MSELIPAKAISGFPEGSPAERLVEERFIETIRRQYLLYGFTPIETPAVERLNVLLAKGDMQRQIYTLGKPEEGERKSKDDKPSLGLHFDLTVPLARYVAQRAGELVFPFRRYQIQKVWRGERAQKGRYREFYQCDIDVVGRNSLDLMHDAEMPCVINAIFTELGIPEFEIRISNRKILGAIVAKAGLDDEQLAAVLRAVDKCQKIGLEKTQQELENEGVSGDIIPALMALIEAKTINEARDVLLNQAADEVGLDELQAVMDNATALGMPAGRMRPDFSIARGLDYYTGTIYETFVTGLENMGSVCSGGRYDDLASHFTKQKYPGVGVSIGLSRLLAVAQEAGVIQLDRKTPTEVLVTTQDRDRFLTEYLQLAKMLRAAGISTEVYHEPKGLKDQFKYASECGIPFALVVGESEVAEETIAVKDLNERSQETVKQTDVVEYLRSRLESSRLEKGTA